MSFLTLDSPTTRKISARFYVLLYITPQVSVQRAGRSTRRGEGSCFRCTDGQEAQGVLLFNFSYFLLFFWCSALFLSVPGGVNPSFFIYIVCISKPIIETGVYVSIIRCCDVHFRFRALGSYISVPVIQSTDKLELLHIKSDVD